MLRVYEKISTYRYFNCAESGEDKMGIRCLSNNPNKEHWVYIFLKPFKMV